MRLTGRKRQFIKDRRKKFTNDIIAALGEASPLLSRYKNATKDDLNNRVTRICWVFSNTFTKNFPKVCYISIFI